MHIYLPTMYMETITDTILLQVSSRKTSFLKNCIFWFCILKVLVYIKKIELHFYFPSPEHILIPRRERVVIETKVKMTIPLEPTDELQIAVMEESWIRRPITPGKLKLYSITTPPSTFSLKEGKNLLKSFLSVLYCLQK